MKQLNRLALFAAFFLSIPQVYSQSQISKSIPNLELFLLPLKMTPNGIRDFFELMYNTKQYQEFLPESFTHLVQFLNHGKQTNQGREYVKSTLALFRQKLKGCRYVDAYVFSTVLVQLPESLDYLFINSDRAVDYQRKAIKQALYNEFLNNFDEFKKDPATFFDALSSTIMSDIDPEQGQTVGLECLRQSVIRLLETGISKLVWEPSDKDIWKNVTDTAEHLAMLYDYKIITDPDDLNDLCCGLIYRLADFMDATAPALSTEFFETLNTELRNPTHPLLLMPEQDDLALSKKELLERAMIDSYAKKQAFEQGLIID